MYWNGRVSTNMKEQQDLRTELKSELESIRNASRKDVAVTDKLIHAWSCKTEELDSKSNWQNNKIFCDTIKRQSLTVNTRMKVLAGRIIQHCVEIIDTVEPPCKFSAVALGSLAKGEATPYSDLEFMFLVERKTEESTKYFELLAMCVYFMIGNLQETKLKYMNIKELKDFKDNGMNGFKIDGLQAKAGNIPTGNGTKEQKNKFILTVDELVQKYQTVLQNPHPEESLKGDFTAMLAHTASLYGDASLLGQFESRRRELPINEARKQLNLKMLQQDIKDYDFLPQMELLLASYRANVKSAIYRFPSILTYNLKIFYKIESQTSWETLDILMREGLLSSKIYGSLCFLLASAIYIRTAAYVYHDSQNEDMSFLQALPNSSGGALWHMPGPLVLHMSLHMVPIKQYLTIRGVENVLRSLQGDIVYDKRRAAASINFYSENYGEVIEIFEALKYKTLSDYVRLAHSYMFFHQWEKFQHTVHMIISDLEVSLQLCYDEDLQFALVYWRYKSATGYAQQNSTFEAERAYKELLNILPDEYPLNHEIFMHIGIFYGRNLTNLSKAEEYFEKSWNFYLSLQKRLANNLKELKKRFPNYSEMFESEFCYYKGVTLSDSKEYVKAEKLLLRCLELRLKLYGNRSASSGVGWTYHALGNVYAGLGQPIKAMEYQQKSQQHLQSNPHNNKDTIYMSMALDAEDQGNYQDCEKYYRMALEAASKSLPSKHPSLADFQRRVACALMFQRKLTEAKKYLELALATYEANLNHDFLQEELARLHSDFGQLYIYEGMTDAAIRHLERSLQYKLDMNNYRHRDTVFKSNHMLAHIYEQSYDFRAIDRLKMALEILPERTEFSDSEVAKTHLQLGSLYTKYASVKCSTPYVKQESPITSSVAVVEIFALSYSHLKKAFRLVIKTDIDKALSMKIVAEMLNNWRIWGLMIGFLQIKDLQGGKIKSTKRRVVELIGPKGEIFFM